MFMKHVLLAHLILINRDRARDIHHRVRQNRFRRSETVRPSDRDVIRPTRSASAANRIGPLAIALQRFQNASADLFRFFHSDPRTRLPRPIRNGRFLLRACWSDDPAGLRIAGDIDIEK